MHSLPLSNPWPSVFGVTTDCMSDQGNVHTLHWIHIACTMKVTMSFFPDCAQFHGAIHSQHQFITLICHISTVFLYVYSMPAIKLSILQLNLYSKSYRDDLFYNFYDFLSTEQKNLMLGFNVQSSWALLSWLLITVFCGLCVLGSVIYLLMMCFYISFYLLFDMQDSRWKLSSS